VNGERTKGALITGGSSGIGLACARALHADGYRVALCGRDGERVRRAAAAIGEDANGVACDVADRGAVERFVAETAEQFGRIDVIVAAAVIYAVRDTVAEIASDAWQEVLDVNLSGVMHTLSAAVPHLRASRGYAFVLSSVSGKQGMAGSSVYCASKWGVLGLTHSFIKEEARHGVRATAICPGLVDTPMVGGGGATPAPEMLSPNDVAETVRFCLSLSPIALVREIVLERVHVA
jgi:NAD(P)-dependent dehydrogenase (short-subunit alcohol dehydrogenase family)